MSEFAQASASCPMIAWWQLTDRLWQAASQQGRLQEKEKGLMPLFSFPFPDERNLFQIAQLDGVNRGDEPKVFVFVIMEMNGRDMVDVFQ